MPIAEDDAPKRTAAHAVGEDLATLSLAELADRIALLRAEIVRIEDAIRFKQSGAAAADAIFRR